MATSTRKTRARGAGVGRAAASGAPCRGGFNRSRAVSAPGIAVVRTNADVGSESEVELVASPPGLLDVSKSRTLEETAEEVREWIEDQRYPVILEWTTENKPFIFTRRPGFETHVLLFLPPVGWDEISEFQLT